MQLTMLVSRLQSKDVSQPGGVGQTTPKGWKDAGCLHPDLEGVSMPDVKEEPGPSTENDVALRYDEFICYAVEQVRLRYLLRVKMNDR